MIDVEEVLPTLPHRSSPNPLIAARSGHPSFILRDPSLIRQPSLETCENTQARFLKVFFPLPFSFNCLIAHWCQRPYHSSTWTSQRGSLTRHLIDDHNLRTETRYWCVTCNSDPGVHPVTHPCIQMAPSSGVKPKLQFPCSICDESFSTKRGLANHLRGHATKTVRADPRHLPISPSEFGTPRNRSVRTRVVTNSGSGPINVRTSSNIAEDAAVREIPEDMEDIPVLPLVQDDVYMADKNTTILNVNMADLPQQITETNGIPTTELTRDVVDPEKMPETTRITRSSLPKI